MMVKFNINNNIIVQHLHATALRIMIKNKMLEQIYTAMNET